MVFRLRIVNLSIKLIKNNILMSLIVFYFFLSICLQLFFSINILIPCLWKLIFHKNCIGCGTSTAFIQLLKFDFSGAFHSNPIIFIIVPIGIFYFYSALKKQKLT